MTQCVRYSPRPALDYTKEGEGHGKWYHQDPEKWNLIWLSFPQLDLYLDTSKSIDDVMSTFDHEYVGAVGAALHPDIVENFPNLRAILRQPAPAFMKSLLAGPWTELPAYMMYGMKWIDTMRARASALNPAQVAHFSTRSSEDRFSNVIYLSDFRRR